MIRRLFGEVSAGFQQDSSLCLCEKIGEMLLLTMAFVSDLDLLMETELVE